MVLDGHIGDKDTKLQLTLKEVEVIIYSSLKAVYSFH